MSVLALMPEHVTVTHITKEDLFPAEVLEETDWPTRFCERMETSAPPVMPSDVREDHRRRYSVIGDCMSHLSHDERKVVRMYYFHSLSWDEIASQLKMTTGEVRHHAVSGIGKMRRAGRELKKVS